MKLNCEGMYIELLESLKNSFWLTFTALIAVFAPVQNILILLFWSFFFNIVIGFIADVHVNNASFNIKKAFNAITQLMFYSACVVFLDFGSTLLGENSLGEKGVKWLTCIVVYFYFANIFRNAVHLFPKSNAIKFIYELLSTEIFERLKEMIGFKSNRDDNK